MSWRLFGLFVMQVFLLALATFFLRDAFNGCLFHGVLFAQFALVGIWLGVAHTTLLTRIVGALIFTIGLCAALFSLPGADGWLLLLAMTRIVALGATYIAVRHRLGLVLIRTERTQETMLVRLSLKQLLVLIFAIALLFSLMRLLDRYAGPLYEILLVALTIIVGLSGALVALTASIVVFSKRNVTNVVVATGGIVAMAMMMAWFAYAGTNSSTTAIEWFASHITEAITVAISLVFIQQLGYGLKSRGVGQAVGR